MDYEKAEDILVISAAITIDVLAIAMLREGE